MTPRVQHWTCTVEGCEKPHLAKGLCGMHYARSVRPAARPKKALAERVAERYAVDENGCWIWQGSPAGNGYGRISVQDRLQYAHRVSYEVHVGPIPDGLEIDHLCRVRLCVRPDHLEPVTTAENVRRANAVRWGGTH